MALESEIFLERKSRLSCIFNIEPELNIAKWPLMNRFFGKVSQSQVQKVSNLITFDSPAVLEILWKV